MSLSRRHAAMRQLLVLAFAFLAAVVVPPAAAQGPVQIGLAGEIYDSGGSLVEIEVVFVPDGGGGAGTRTVALAMHFGWRTSASDVAYLLTRRLEAAGAMVRSPGERGVAQPVASVFIGDVHAVRTRLGYGLTAAITLGETPPNAIRLVPPTMQAGGGQLVLGASTLHPHQGNRGRMLIELEIDPRHSTAQVTGALLERSIGAGWIAERVNGDAWHPTATTDGAQVTGCSVSLQSSADWRLEVELPAKRRER